MSYTNEPSDHCFQLSFTKGMTLEQYMAGLTFNNLAQAPHHPQQPEENLYDTTLPAQLEHKHPVNSRIHSMLDIQEENQEEVRDSIETEPKKWQLPEQLTKATFREDQDESIEKRKSVHVTSKLNSTAYFGNSPQDKGFRIKHVSNSPSKKIKENSTGVPNSSMTLYGVKFNYSKERQAGKMNEMVTFYGKVRMEAKQEKKCEGRSSNKNMKKKNPVQMQGMLQVEKKTKIKLVNKMCLPDIKIEGLRDKILDRKNKFF